MNNIVAKHFFRQKSIIFITVALFLISLGFCIFFSILGMTAFEVLHTLCRFEFYTCFVWVCITFGFVSRAVNASVREVSDSYAGKYYSYEMSASTFLLIVYVVWNVCVVGILLFCSLKNDGTSFFCAWFWKSYFINVVFPQLICAGLTIAVVISSRQYAAFFCLIFFLFMISPFAEQIVWVSSTGLKIEKIWEIIRHPFLILYQNGEWAPDSMYGLQTETFRIELQIFWLVSIVFILLARFTRKSLWYIGLIFACSMLVISFIPFSAYRLNANWNGIFYDRTIYADSNNESDNGNKTCADSSDVNFTVTEYQLDVKLKRAVSVDLNMRICAETPIDNFLFTLYRGYRVDSVYANDESVSISWIQNGDELVLNTEKTVSELIVYISYHGHSSRFYSNSEACLLPGWFAWYPMPGRHEIFTYDDSGAYGYNPYNRIRETTVYLKVNKEAVTNLNKTRDGYYSDKADSITLMTGNLVSVETQQNVSDNMPSLIDYLPLNLYKGQTEQKYIEQENENIKREIEIFKQYFQNEQLDFGGMKIIYSTEDLGRNFSNNNIAIFDDYILCSAGYFSARNLFYYLAQENAHRTKLADVILNHISLYQNPSDSVIDFSNTLSMWKNILTQEDERLSVELETLESICNSYINQKKELELMQMLTGYAINQSAYQNDSEFIEYLQNGVLNGN